MVINMKLKINRKKISYIYLVIYTFIFVFAPPFFPTVNIVIILSIVSLFSILIKYKKDFNFVIKNSGIASFVKCFFIYILYVTMIILVNFLLGERVQITNYITSYYQYFMILPVSFICVIYLIMKGIRLGLSKDQFMFLFIYASLIQLVLVILAIIFPTVKSFFVDIMYRNTGEVLLTNSWVTHRRFNGFANNMLDLFGFSIGILGTIPLFLKATMKNKKYLILVPLISIISLMNARSGLIIIMIGIILYVIYSMRSSRKQILSNIILFLVILIISSVLFFYINRIMPDTIAWVINDFLSFFGLSDNSVSNSLAEVYFSDKFWNIPSIEYLFIGTGHTLYGLKGVSSDIGYINELWRSGLFGIIILFTVFFNLFKTLKRENERCYRILIFFFLISFISFNFKANALNYNGGIVTILAITYYFSCWNYKHRKKENRNGTSKHNSPDL